MDLELGVVGTEEGVEDEWCLGGSMYPFRITCKRLMEGDPISTTGFLFLGVIGIGELFAMTARGSGLESGGALTGEALATLDTGVFVGLAMRGGGGGGGAA